MRAAIYCRVSTLDQHPETQLLDLQQLAAQRNLTVVQIYTDHGFSGTKSRRPGLDEMLYDAKRHQFDVVWFGLPTAWPAASSISWISWLNSITSRLGSSATASRSIPAVRWAKPS
jgi:hypothetical protein